MLNLRTLHAPRGSCPLSSLGSEGKAGGLDLGPQCQGAGHGIFEVVESLGSSDREGGLNEERTW